MVQVALSPGIEPFLSSAGDLYLLPPGIADQLVVHAPYGELTWRMLTEGTQPPPEHADTVLRIFAHLADQGMVCQAQHVESPDTQLWSRQMGLFAQSGLDGPAAQRRLLASTVLVVGVGGVGSAIAEPLARMGVGRIVCVDGDVVEDVNLPRQCLYSTEDVGGSKVAAAARRLRAISDACDAVAIARHIDGAEDVAKLIADHLPDMVIAAADVPPLGAKLAISDACFAAGVPVFMGGHRPPFSYVGPLLVPGRTACYSCFHKTWAGGDPPPLQDEIDAWRETHPMSIPAIASGDQIAGGWVAFHVMAHLVGLDNSEFIGRELELSMLTGATRWLGPGVAECQACRPAAARVAA